MILRGPFQPLPFCDSVILQTTPALFTANPTALVHSELTHFCKALLSWLGDFGTF